MSETRWADNLKPQVPLGKLRERRQQRRDIDWPAVEHDYRIGLLSLRELALKHGCSHSAIANFASRHGWRPKRSEEVAGR